MLVLIKYLYEMLEQLIEIHILMRFQLNKVQKIRLILFIETSTVQRP
jgi:hypothetical protein